MRAFPARPHNAGPDASETQVRLSASIERSVRVDRPVFQWEPWADRSVHAAARPTRRHQVTRPERSVRNERVPAVPALVVLGSATVRQPVEVSTRQAPRRSVEGDQQAAGPAEAATQVG